MTKRLADIILVIGIIIPLGCKGDGTPAPSPPHEYSRFFSFESSLESWTVAGTDLYGPLVVWAIDRTQRVGAHGHSAVEFYLNNLNDAGKIWIQQSFPVLASTRYRVRVTYQFGTSDFGDLNLWTIITGVRRSPPQTRDDLSYQGNTGNGASSDVGLRWMVKDYEFDMTSAGNGVFWIIIGVWGTWETPRTYYLDALRVTFREVREEKDAGGQFE